MRNRWRELGAFGGVCVVVVVVVIVIAVLGFAVVVGEDVPMLLLLLR